MDKLGNGINNMFADRRLSDGFFHHLNGVHSLQAPIAFCELCGEHIKYARYANGFVPLMCSCKNKKEQQYYAERQQEKLDIELRKLQEQQDRRYTWLWPSHRLNDVYRRATFERWNIEEQKAAYAIAIAYVNNPVNNLLFTGSYGTGKTLLACAIINALTIKGYVCRFTTANLLFDAIYASYNDKARMSEAQIIEQASTCDVLVIDDLCKMHLKIDEFGECFQHSKLFTIFDNRQGLPTIITMNRQDTAHFIGDAAYSRFKRALKIVPMYGSDYREEFTELDN